jgi:hypothetical protein
VDPPRGRGELCGRSGSATQARRGREPGSRGTNHVVVESASVEAIVGDKLGRGASGGAPERTTMGGPEAELNQAHNCRR